MQRFYRFMILALVGFAIGGGIAVLQQSRENQPEPAAVVASGEDQVGIDLPTAVAIDSAAEDMVSTDAPTEMAATDHSGHDMVDTIAAPAPAVAGSSVGGAFELTDHNGQTVTDQSWPGQHTLVFFGFTHCPDICPAALDKMTAALNALGPDSDRLQPLFITIDPARDDVATMKTYLENYHPAILGLTGTEVQIKQVEKGYKVYAAKVDGGDPENYTMAHSSYVFLMSPEGELLEVFRDADPADTLAAKIKARLAP